MQTLTDIISDCSKFSNALLRKYSLCLKFSVMRELFCHCPSGIPIRNKHGSYNPESGLARTIKFQFA